MSAPKPQYIIEIQSPFPESAYPSIWVWAQSFWNDVSDDGSPKTLEEFVAFQKDRAERVITWGVYRKDQTAEDDQQPGELGGYIEFAPANNTMGVGHALFKKSFWGQKTTVPAINQAAFRIFGMGIELLLFTPFAHNAGIIALLKRIGAREVGRIKGRTTQQDKPVDTLVFGLVSDEWVERNPSFVIDQIPRMVQT